MRDYEIKTNLTGSDVPDPDYLNSGEFNSIAVELENSVTAADLTLSTAAGVGDVANQLSQAITIMGGGGADYYLDTGGPDAYVCTLAGTNKYLSNTPVYFDGMTVVFQPGTLNTGASTVNVNGLGVKEITNVGGAAVAAGQIDNLTVLRYNINGDGGTGTFEIKQVEAGNLANGAVQYLNLYNGATESLNTRKRVAKAWGRFNMVPGGPVTIRENFNVSTAPYIGTGIFQVNFNTNFTNGLYCVTLGGNNTLAAPSHNQSIGCYDITSSGFKICTGISGAANDWSVVSFAAYGDIV